MQNIHIRLATIRDLDFILSMLPRLSEFGPPAWRDANSMLLTDTNIIKAKLNDSAGESVIYLAESNENIPLGFVHLQPGNDYYYKEPHAHISDLIVSASAGGQGVGLRLIDQAETWARQNGYRWLTLSVFAQNTRARELYSRLGFGEDIMKYVKQL